MNSGLHLLKWGMWKWSACFGQQVKIKYGMLNCILTIQYRILWLGWDCDVSGSWALLYFCLTAWHLGLQIWQAGSLVQSPTFCLLYPGLMCFSDMIKKSSFFWVKLKHRNPILLKFKIFSVQKVGHENAGLLNWEISGPPK